ncbi:MAG: 3'-5' exonuclease [Deltaproteobacteria bacterium]|nr:3'-5' exonuclease [Deltaproteobacteria bacterium]
MKLLFIICVIAIFVAYFSLSKRKSGIQQISTDLLPDSFIVVDLETTGLDPLRHEIIEIGAIKFKKGFTTHDTFQTFIKPSKPIPKEITDITGITQEMVEREGEPPSEALQAFADFVGDLRLVSYNADFDIAFLSNATRMNGIPEFRNPVSCALKMARRAWPKRSSYRLNDLAADGQMDQGTAHRAIDDSRRTLIIYAAAVAELKAISDSEDEFGPGDLIPGEFSKPSGRALRHVRSEKNEKCQMNVDDLVKELIEAAPKGGRWYTIMVSNNKEAGSNWLKEYWMPVYDGQGKAEKIRQVADLLAQTFRYVLVFQGRSFGKEWYWGRRN